MAKRPFLTRRSFLRAAGAAGVAPMLIPASARGVDGRPAPSRRITVGMIGTGRQAFLKSLKQFLEMPDVQVVAVSDVDSWRMDQVRQAVESRYGKEAPSGKYAGCAAYRDFRDLLGRREIDTVMISTPDHWHAPMAIAAAEAGKDVSLEKPITRTIAEGQEIIRAIRRKGRVFRVDSEFRSLENFHRMAELVRNGRIGRIQAIRVGVPAGDDVACPPTPETPVPEELDYEMWQGPAPRAPYTEHRVHPVKHFGRPGWMRVLYYCDGMITNWGTHLCDMAQWCNGTERTGPVEIEGRGVYPPPDQLWNVLKTFRVSYRFADGTPLVYETTKPYVRFEGSEGWISAGYPRTLEAGPESILTSEIKPDEIHFPFKSDKRDFIDAVKTRGKTLEDEEVGHRTTSLCHLGHIAIQAGEKLKWDPDKERFVDNDAANALLEKPIHRPAELS